MPKNMPKYYLSKYQLYAIINLYTTVKILDNMMCENVTVQIFSV